MTPKQGFLALTAEQVTVLDGPMGPVLAAMLDCARTKDRDTILARRRRDELVKKVEEYGDDIAPVPLRQLTIDRDSIDHTWGLLANENETTKLCLARTLAAADGWLSGDIDDYSAHAEALIRQGDWHRSVAALGWLDNQ